MKEPKIVFCSSNHIYDSALHSECPYCKEIRNNRKKLDSTVNVADDGENDATELIMDDDSPDSIMDDDLTELIEEESRSANHSDDDTPTEYEDDNISVVYTDDDIPEQKHEESISTEHEESVEEVAVGNVLGWLVCKNGEQKGKSFEILEGENILCSSGAKISVIHSEDKIKDGMERLAIIFRDTDESLLIQPKDGVQYRYNGIEHSECVDIHNYSMIVINESKLLFVELLRDFVDW